MGKKNNILVALLILLAVSSQAQGGPLDVLESFRAACVRALQCLDRLVRPRDNWFSPDFKNQGKAERWMLSLLPRLSLEEKALLFAWPREGRSAQANDILRSGQLSQQSDKQIFIIDEYDMATLGGPGGTALDFTLSRIIRIFDRLHARCRTSRPITGYRTIGSSQLSSDLEVGQILEDSGYMNVTLSRDFAEQHGRAYGRYQNGFVRLILEIPRGYPMVPTLAHYSYIDSTGQRNVVSQELELVLKRGTRFRTSAISVDSNGITELTGKVVP